jgi:hypothetical protein
MLINSAFVLLARILQLPPDLAMELLHFCSKIFCSSASDLTLFQVSQIKYSPGLHSIQYLERDLPSAPIW